ncbi:heme-binding protein [Magnetospira sp. QH-2]|uniref:GlcG/HbpS family heme-binding protein n=1 Tax=Magnetospira sp. (strain QH-2) TaxID=1288970 RepID=UPI0003E814DE|nr:heme-binding protein [Magnetospira sp. QH-2]CCQ72087.1 conserved protein of unknown function [Magnetospira sp. QH-2]
MYRFLIVLGALFGVTLTLPSKSLAEGPALHGQRTLSLDLAQTAARAALDHCKEAGYAVAVAVVDRGGHAQVLLRDRFAGPHTIDTAMGKAWTANSFRESTGNLAALLAEGVLPARIPDIPGTLLIPGGRIVEAAGATVGAIGVSGAPRGESDRNSIDGACAQAGIDAIIEAIEFAD